MHKRGTPSAAMPTDWKARALAAEAERDDAWKDGHDEGRIRERAEVVAWLRHSDRDHEFGPRYAARVEAKEHLKRQGDGQ